MSDDELKALQKEVSQKKRIASDCASAVHDLVEDRLWNAFGELPDLAARTVAACEAWQEAKKRLDAAEKAVAAS